MTFTASLTLVARGNGDFDTRYPAGDTVVIPPNPSQKNTQLINVSAAVWLTLNSNTLASVAPGGKTGNVMAPWGDACYDTDRDRLVVWGGGHGDYDGNEVYAFDTNLATGTGSAWSRLTNASADTPDVPYGADQRPSPRHTYKTLTYAPFPDSKMVVSGASAFAGPTGGTGGGYVDYYDFTKDGIALDGSQAPWSRGPSLPAFSFGSPSVFEPATRTVWHWYQAIDGGGVLRSLNLAASNPQWQSNPSETGSGTSSPFFMYYPNAAIDTNRRLMVSIGLHNSGDVNLPPVLNCWDLSSRVGFAPIQSVGAPHIVAANQSVGIIYDTLGQRFIVWVGGIPLYTLTPPAGNAQTGTWLWGNIAISPANTVNPGAVTAGGVFGRFFYIPLFRAVGVVSAINTPVYVLRLP